MRRRILMLLEGHFPAMGGAERQVETLANALLDAGHEVTVLVPRLDRGDPPGASVHGRLPVWRIDYPAWRGLGSVLLMLRLAWLLWRWRGRYDAVHVHIAHHMGAVASVVGALVGKPVIVKFSGWWEQEKGCLRPGGGAGAAIARAMLRRASAVQAISTRIRDELRRRGFDGSRLHWIPNGLDTRRFEGARSVPLEEAKRIVFVGRLVAEKGLDTLIAAWANAQRPDGWHLRLVGDGGQRASLEALARQLGVAGSVEFAGASDRVERELGAAAAGVLPSRFEGLSNTLLESMAAGLPMVATRISGSEDFVVPRRNGWLCEVDDVAGLAAALSEAMAIAPGARAAMGALARQDVLARASLPSVVDALMPLYAGRAR